VLPDRYANVERIGLGGMGEIFRADDTALGRTVAVKVLAERYAADESVRARFTREAHAAARLSAAPNTVTIFDVGEEDGRPYIVMELMRGGSLADRLAEGGAQPPARALVWLEDAARALDAAHEHGVVHRDVKPGNLLLDSEGHVKVADFGIATAAGLHSLTQDGTVLGTAGYLAPEQARGSRATAASDRYALAVVAYELLSGQRPFERESPTAEATAHANEPPPPITSVAPHLPGALDPVFARALAKDPGGRFETCGEFVDAIRRAMRQDAATTRIVAPPAPVPVPSPAAAASRRRVPWPLLAGIVLLLALAGVGLAAALNADDPQTVERTVTGRGRTVERTVTSRGRTVTVTTVTTTSRSEPTSSASSSSPSSGSASALNDQGYALMQQGDFRSALPLLEQAVAAAEGTGSLTEAYADYNLAYTRMQLGSCEGVLALLDRSQQVQGERKEIDRLRREAERTCGGGNANGGEGEG
jgi:eukaryotic-like serine/threonine-protein kinase